jgi:ketosteroid isomerase-like protein
MNRIVKAVCLIAVLLPMQLSGQGNGAPIGSRGERENLAIAIEWDDAFNSENLEAVMALYADDAVSMPPGFPALVGKPSIQADYEYLFEHYDFHHETTVVQLEIQGSLAVERGEYVMLVVPTDGSGEPFIETGKHMIVRRQIDGSWYVIEETWNTH